VCVDGCECVCLVRFRDMVWNVCVCVSGCVCLCVSVLVCGGCVI